VGIFSAVTLGRMARWVWPVAILWAMLVSFSQVYVGVHYPLDVSCGALLGSTIGILVGWVDNRYFDLQSKVESIKSKAAM
jgi:undecaprenyl-diphosphatase